MGDDQHARLVSCYIPVCFVERFRFKPQLDHKQCILNSLQMTLPLGRAISKVIGLVSFFSTCLLKRHDEEPKMLFSKRGGEHSFCVVMTLCVGVLGLGVKNTRGPHP